MLLSFGQQYGVPSNRAANAVPLLFVVKTQCLWAAGGRGGGWSVCAGVTPPPQHHRSPSHPR
eukprot:1022439-Rhodomonas_salina.1